MKWPWIILCLAVASNSSCKDPLTEKITFGPNYDPYKVDTALSYDPTPNLSGYVQLDEASGMVQMMSWSNGVWLINDSGDGPKLYAVNRKTGKTVCSLLFSSLNAVDWEDLSIYTDSSGDSWLYVGDIGDNQAQRTSVQVYRFKEPKLEELDTLSGQQTWSPIQLSTWNIVYPGGSRDAEALFVDPLTGQPWIITKRTSRAMVYSLPIISSNIGIDTAVFEGSLPFQLLTSADSKIFNNGECPILMRNYNALWIWNRTESESIPIALSRTPLVLPYSVVEPQGESICFLGNGDIAVVSERVDSTLPVIYTYRLK